MYLSSTPSRRLQYILPGLAIMVSSCFTVKNYPSKPFVYKTEIEVVDPTKKVIEKTLLPQLKEHLHDSIRVQIRNKFLINKVLDKPAVYDSLHAEQSMQFMSNMLHASGYYSDSIAYRDTTEVVGDQQRVTVYFTVWPGRLYTINDINYNVRDTSLHMPSVDTLQKLVDNSKKEQLINKGDAFALKPISAELDRIADLGRDNGYLRFSKEQLVVSWDTLGLETLSPLADPFQQYEALLRRRQNPTADLEIRLKPQTDSSRLIRYYIGNVKIYPDQSEEITTDIPRLESFPDQHYQFYHYGNRFRGRKITPFIYLTHGEIYRQSNYLRTVNKLSSLDAWKAVQINPLPRPGQDTVDFEVRLQPARKYGLRADVEISNNQGSIVSEGNLLGFGTNLTVTDRNLAKGVNKSVFHARYGVELSPQLDSIQSNQLILDYSISFPRLVPKFIVIPKTSKDEARTTLGFRLGAVDRLDYYTIRGVNLSWGIQYRKRRALVNVRVVNLEYNVLQKKAGLETLIKENASYKYIFNDGYVMSILANATWPFSNKNRTSIVRVGGETAGVLSSALGIHKAFAPNQFYRFLKGEAEYAQKIRIRRSAFAWRVFAGAGIGLPFDSAVYKQRDSINVYMPFFRQYYAGGPGSMRAWSVRKLGPGSTIKSYDKEIAPDRYGDMRLELNLEYRMYLFTAFGFNFETALFTDIGNIWYIRFNKDFEGGQFQLKKLAKDIAIGAGTGLRMDLSFITIRIDYAYKVKDPSPSEEDAASQNKWFYKWELWNGQVQLGINYAF